VVERSAHNRLVAGSIPAEPRTCDFRDEKFALNYITRDDITALTEEAVKVSGIHYVIEVDKEEAEKILES
jgi:hypothetical protein